ncbi:MAG: aspartate aminotransferase family protein [Mariniblastus sp.]|nr:aspartate aminotransferase family protein [Mariniblastus sp.]
MDTEPKTGTRSRELFEQARQYLPGGVSRNTIFRQPHPLYAESAEGYCVTDVDGVQRIDFANNMASLIHGHAHPAIIAAVSDQLQRGTAYTMATEAELDFARLLCERVPHFDKLRFVNSGTEAVMACIKAARCFTGRAKLAKVEGTYHGTYDYAEISQKPKPEEWGDAQQPASVPVARGTPQGALDDVIVIPFNQPKLAREILDTQADQIACILLDPMPHRVGLIPASNDFVEMLRQWCDTNGALLILDEVITFRSGYAGAGEWFTAKPDLTAMGKIIGGGFPVGAFAGRNDVMNLLDPQQGDIPFPHSGTFSANPITMTAGRVAMERFDQEAVDQINDLGRYARGAITETIRQAGIEACVTGEGSMFRIHLKPQPPVDYRSAYMHPVEQQRINRLVSFLFDNGFLMINTCTAALSTVMNREQIDQLATQLGNGFRQLEKD